MLCNERMLSLDEAGAFLPGRPSKTSVWRWCRRGLNGVRLEYVRIGRRMWTSAEALERFARRLAEIDTGTVGSADLPPATESTRSVEMQRAEDILARAHI